MRDTNKALLASLIFFVIFGASCSHAPQTSSSASPVLKTPSSAATEQSKQEKGDQTDFLGTTPPETVRVESVRIVKGVKNLSIGNAQGRYALACNTNQDSCVTPIPGKDYLLFTKSTRWKKPGAKDFITLEWLQHWSGSYNDQENIGLIPADDSGITIGIYWLRSWEPR